MGARTGAILFSGALLVSGCGYPIRMVAVLETEDAIYGETKIGKAQNYDPNAQYKQEDIGFFEALVGVFNSDSAKAIRENPQPATSRGLSPSLPPAR